MSTFQSELKRLLDETGAKQVDIAKYTNIPTSALSSYVRGHYEPKEENKQKILDFFKINYPETEFYKWEKIKSNAENALEALNSIQSPDELIDILFPIDEKIQDIIESIENYKVDKALEDLNSLSTGLNELLVQYQEDGLKLDYQIKTNKRAVELSEQKLRELNSE